MGRIAAIDYGQRRIGIAISDASRRIALPLTSVPGGREGVANAARALSNLGNPIEKILVGLPLLMSGEKGEMAKEVEVFAKALEVATGIPIEFCDERLTSKMADRELRELAMKRKKRTEHLDQAAATLILQTYLDKNSP